MHLAKELCFHASLSKVSGCLCLQDMGSFFNYFFILLLSPKQNGSKAQSVLGYVCAAVQNQIMADSAFGEDSVLFICHQRLKQ